MLKHFSEIEYNEAYLLLCFHEKVLAGCPSVYGGVAGGCSYFDYSCWHCRRAAGTLVVVCPLSIHRKNKIG